MKKFILIASLIFVKLISYGQDNNAATRDAFKLQLAVNDTDYYQADIKASAYILPNNIIQLYPGEKIFVEVEIVDNEIKSMQSVKSITHPEKTITISFTQTVQGKKAESMILKIENPFSNNIEYRANIFLMKQKIWIKTNVLPVRAKIASYETWSDIIVTVALSGWKLVK